MACEYQKLIDAGQIRFLAYGNEVCPTSGKPHHQLFLYLHNPRSSGVKTLNELGSLFGPVHCRVAPMKGTISQNEAYCSKEGTLIKVGDEPQQGCRGDLIETKESIMRGMSVDSIALENPEMYHQYGRTLERIEAIALRKRYRTQMTRGVWITGPAQAGKSHMAFEGFTPETHYVKNLNEDWWDGYKGQETVIFNEFRGHHMQFSELLDLVDKWPKTVRWRNREPVPFLAKTVIITSIKTPRACYVHALAEDEPWAQFERRFTIVTLEQKCSEGNIETSEPTSGPLDQWLENLASDSEESPIMRLI